MTFLPILRPGPGVQTLESERPLSQSALWALNERFFRARGPSAWTHVPDYITTNQWNARVQADLVFGFLQDLVATGHTGPVTVIELAAGTGRLGVRLHRFLRRLLKDSHLADLEVRMVLTDLVDANLERARQEPGTHCVAWDVASDTPPVPLDGPVVVVANYCFDGVPNDAYVVVERELYALHAGLCIEDGVDGDDPELVSRVGLFWEPVEPSPSPYQALLDHYTQTVSGSFALPVSALAMLERVRKWSPQHLLIVADKATHRLQDVARRDVPRIACHGSVSMAVNLHAMCWWHEHTGGHALSAWHRATGLDTVALAGGVSPVALRRAYRRWEDLDTGTYQTVRGMIAVPASKREAMALLRFSGHEPISLARSMEALEAAVHAGELGRNELDDLLARVEATSWLDRGSDVARDAAQLRAALEARNEPDA